MRKSSDREEGCERRTYLKGIASTGFGAGALTGFSGISEAASNAADKSGVLGDADDDTVQIASTSRSCYYYTIRQGTPEATQVYVIRSGNPGPTGFVIGGVHGNEPSGYITASYIRRQWDVEQGTLVVLPRANEVAIDQGTREYDEGDLNRKFPIGSEPTTALARAIWNTVVRHEPDLVIDAHSSRGIYQSSTSGCPEAVGQSIRPSPGMVSTQRALDTIEDLNQNYVPDSLPDDYYFDLRTLWYGDGRLLEKLHVDLGVPSFTPEVARCGLNLYTQRVPWTRFMVRNLLEQYGLFSIELPNTGHCNSLPAVSTGSVTRDQPTPNTWYRYNAPAQPDRVVVAKPLSFNGGQPCHVRLRNATTGDFGFKLEEWAYLDGLHVTEKASFVAVEPGVRTLHLSDGSAYQLRAGSVPTTDAFSTVSYRSPFASQPVVLTQTQTYNGPDPVVTRVRNVSTTSFGVRLQEEEAQGAHTQESVGYISLQQAKGTLKGKRFEVRRLPETFTHQWGRINFQQSYNSPRFIAGLQTFNGTDTAQLRFRNLTAGSVDVKVEEEQSADTETVHAAESVGYAVFES